MYDIKSEKLKNFKFPGQRKNEKVKLVVRKHWASIIPSLFYIFLMILIPFIFYFIFAQFIFTAFLEAPYSRLFILLCIIYYGFVWIAIFTVWVDYYFDIWIITNERLLDIEQIGFFNRVVSDLDFRNMQDITSEVHGIFPTIFGFGNVYIQTAGEEERFIMELVPHPVSIRRKITKLHYSIERKNKNV